MPYNPGGKGVTYMFNTVQLNMDNWKYVLETNFFKSDEEYATFFRWITKINEFNFIVDKEGTMVETEFLGDLGGMEITKAIKFIERLKENGFLLEVIMPDSGYYIINPNIAVPSDAYTNWIHIFKGDFLELEQNGVLKDLPHSYWKETFKDES